MMIDLDVTLLYVPSANDPLRGTMRVGYSADLWEGTDEGRNDLDGQTRDGHADDLVITDPALPGHVVIPFSVRNVEEDADDTASGTITVSYVP